MRGRILDAHFERLLAFSRHHGGPPRNFLEYRRRQLELALYLSGVDLDGMHVVEVGGGVSGQSFLLTSRAARVTSMDLLSITSAHGSDIAQAARIRGLSPERLAFVCGRGEAIPLRDACADVVFSSYVLEHVSDRSAAVAEFRRVLRPGGVAVILVPNVMESALRAVWYGAVYFPRQLAKATLLRTGLARRLGIPVRFAPDLRFHPHGTYAGLRDEVAGSRGAVWDALFRENGFDVVRRFTYNFEAYVGILGDRVMLISQRALRPLTQRVGTTRVATWLGPGYGLIARRR